MIDVETAKNEEHRRLMGELLNWIKRDGFKVKCANYDGYVACDRWKEPSDQFVPDARGLRMNPDLLCLGESKTAEDIDNADTRAQFSEFSNYLMPGMPGDIVYFCPFYIAIPRGSEKKLIRVLEELDLLDKRHVHWHSF